MGKHKGHRISITLSDGEYEKVKAYVRTHGLTSISAMTKAMYALILWHECANNEADNDDTQTIRSEFDEFARHERQPDGTVPKRRRRASHGE